MFTRNKVYEKTLEYFNGDTLATDVWMRKYALKDNEDNYLELTPDDMHHRLAKEFARIEKKYPYPLTEDEIYGYLKDFKYIVPQGSPMSGIGNNFRKQSLSNCVVVGSPEDTVSGIMEKAGELANLFKARCGVGLDISSLRPDGATVNNAAGTSTGAWSFADLYSYVTKLIGQSGRRGALMVSMDIMHPDIENFITMKHDLTKVTGANISVKIRDDFMEKVLDDGDFILRFPIDLDVSNVNLDVLEYDKIYKENKHYYKKIKAKKLWDILVESATKTAEPGILMWDTIINNLPAHNYPNFETISTNPCGELPLSDGDSCRLITINLKHLSKDCFKSKELDIEKYKEIVRVAMRLSDDLVDLEIEKLEELIDKSDNELETKVWNKLLKATTNGRRTGLGTHGLADLLANLTITYGSEDSLEVIDKVYGILKNISYDTSIELAVERGTFPDYDIKYETSQFLDTLDDDIKERMNKHGRRNISLLTNAPTGSVSIMSQTSSGIEPVFMNSYTRRRKLNKDEIEYDFIDNDGEKFVNYTVYHYNVKDFINKMGETEELPEYFIESENVEWINRVKVQERIQSHIDHSLSSTINLPKETKSSIVSDIYIESWKRNLKGVTVYVDGSRGGILIKEDEKKEKEDNTKIVYREHVKRPDELECHIHHRTVDGDKYVVLIGLLDGKPYEVFAGKEDKIQIPTKYTSGIIKKTDFKTKPNRYDLQIDGDGLIKDIVEVFDNPNNSTLGRMVSLGMRYGAKVSHMVEQLQQTHENSSMTCFSKVLSRVLKEYIPDNTEVDTGKHCPNCESNSLIYVEGCVTCQNCGWSKCS